MGLTPNITVDPDKSAQNIREAHARLDASFADNMNVINSELGLIGAYYGWRYPAGPEIPEFTKWIEEELQLTFPYVLELIEAAKTSGYLYGLFEPANAPTSLTSAVNWWASRTKRIWNRSGKRYWRTRTTGQSLPS